MTCILQCDEGLLIYLKTTDWDVQLRKSQWVQNAYNNHPIKSRAIGLFTAIPIAIAKIVTDPLIATIGLVVFPLFALLKDEPVYWSATFFSASKVVFTATALSLCIFVFTPGAAIAMAVALVALQSIFQIRNFSHLHVYQKNDREFWMKEYFQH